ncbi:MAG: hypothetical protein L6461_05260 [Anaerolineae bacterium]|nr:hypothetical protein [Anaerolineae bacterium]
MNNNKLGCLSPLAIFSGFVTIFALLVLEVLNGNAMFSPGALHATHADIGDDCGQCHAPFWASERLTERCLVCHTEIQGEIGDSSTLHGTLVKGTDSTCQSCHTEHAGPSARLTVMDTANFPHEATGFALTGHQTRSPGISFVCSDCHTESISTFNQQTCAECHRSLDAAYTETHLAAFGADCLACHDGVDRYGDFSHSQTAFDLTGAHTRVECAACHAGARTVAQLQSTDRACESCHLKDDAHNREFGVQCGVCHSPEAWEPAKFDHSLSGFPLEGKHVGVECESCHTQGYAGTPQDCYSCHQADDAHEGQYGIACETCHHPGDWKDATFDHALSNFPLDGAHVNVECAECHKDNVYKGTPVECAACHADPAYHLGLFPGQACSQCHTTAAWRPAPYNGPHTFPMNHGQENNRLNTCADCHQPTLAQWTCYTCHNRAETDQKHREEGIADFNDCLRCHPTGQEGDEGGRDGGDDD